MRLPRALVAPVFLSAALSFGAVVSGSGCSGSTNDAAADGGRADSSSPGTNPTSTGTGTGTSTSTTPFPTNTTPNPPVDGGPDADAEAGPSGGCAGKRVLLLGEGTPDTLGAASTLLGEAGLTVRPIGNYSTDDPADGGDAGTVLRGYDAIVVLSGYRYPSMPEPLQQAVLAAHAGGTGVVFEEWASYHVYSASGFALLAPLMLYAYDDYSVGKLTLTASQAGHPVWAGLPASFTTTVETGLGFGSREAGSGPEATSIATVDVNDAGITGHDVVLVREGTGGAGRVAQTTLAANYASERILTVDANVKRLYQNMAKWVARCN